ncbi:MAG: hypothetical protein LBR44_12525 [Clostridiales Family XIII bacterium]|jgi:hypothetical protein|nr:hypothetical protein [Clostridiales Family XIII bacterium]
MEQIISMDGKYGNIFVFDDRVIFQKWNGKEFIVFHAYIMDILFRPISYGRTGFIKPRSPGAEFDFVAVPLSGGEPPDSPRARHFVQVYETIQSLRAQAQGFAAPRITMPQGHEVSPSQPRY